MLIEDIKEDLNKWWEIPYSWIEKVNPPQMYLYISVSQVKSYQVEYNNH